jgi:5-methylcytosine-specific restriction enzyme A
MNRARMRCRYAGCPELVTEHYCERHRFSNPESNKKADSWYQGPWPKFSVFLRVRNPVCQRLIEGKQCTRASALVHHLISPRINLSLLLVPTNCVCLCRQCHPQDEGTPNWREGFDFIPTRS